jgi:CheY-like chemotaxis protein
MKKQTILWVDDDVDDLMMMKEILIKNNQDQDVVEVHNGREALDYLKQAKQNNNLPCLIILDINMPVMDGKEALAVIRRTEDYMHIPVVVFSTSSSELDKTFCRSLQAEMITKPPLYKSLEKTIMEILNYCSL